MRKSKRLSAEQCWAILDGIDYARDEGELWEVSAVVWRGHQLCWGFPLAWGLDAVRWNALWLFLKGRVHARRDRFREWGELFDSLGV